MPEQMKITPNVDTRAGRMLASGNVMLTLTNKYDGSHITLRFKCIADNRDRSFDAKSNKNWVPCYFDKATHVFIEVPSQGDWADKVGTYYPKRDLWYSDNNADSTRVAAFKTAVVWLNTGLVPPGAFERVQEEARCGVCMHVLSDPISIDRGIGPECYGRMTGSQHQIKHTPDPNQQTFEAFEDGTLHTSDMLFDRENMSLRMKDGRSIAQAARELEEAKREGQGPVFTDFDIAMQAIEQIKDDKQLVALKNLITRRMLRMPADTTATKSPLAR